MLSRRWFDLPTVTGSRPPTAGTHIKNRGAVGEANVIDVPYVQVPEDQVTAFTSRWDGLLGRS